MTRGHKVTTVIIAVTALVGVTACVLLMRNRSEKPSLSLVFERYSTALDFNVQDAAFLWLTNSSRVTYVLPMTGGTNTFEWGSPLLDQYRGSYMVMCEFSDSPHPQVSVIMSWGKCLFLQPHSAVRLRVPLPSTGQKRKVAVLCAEQPEVRQFWTKGIGLSILRILPRSVGWKLLVSQPAVQRLWCDIGWQERAGKKIGIEGNETNEGKEEFRMRKAE